MLALQWDRGRFFLINGALGKVLAQAKTALVFRGDGGGRLNSMAMVLNRWEIIESVGVANLAQKRAMITIAKRLWVPGRIAGIYWQGLGNFTLFYHNKIIVTWILAVTSSSFRLLLTGATPFPGVIFVEDAPNFVKNDDTPGREL